MSQGLKVGLLSPRAVLYKPNQTFTTLVAAFHFKHLSLLLTGTKASTFCLLSKLSLKQHTGFTDKLFRVKQHVFKENTAVVKALRIHWYSESQIMKNA